MLYPDDTFDAVLMWDILDYLDNDLMTKLAARITSLVRDGGVVFAMFHTRKPIIFHRYRVLDAPKSGIDSRILPFPAATRFSEPGNFKSVFPVPHLQNVCRTRPASRRPLRKVSPADRFLAHPSVNKRLMWK